MDVSAEAADVVVRESLQATEAAAKLTLEGMKNVAALLLAIAKQDMKVVGETKSGYLMDDVAQTAVIKAGQTVKLQFVNHKQGNLIIHKLSSLDKTPLEGAQFKLTYANGEVVDTADGKLSWDVWGNEVPGNIQWHDTT